MKEIKLLGDEGVIKYTFPIPPDNHEEERSGVLPAEHYGGHYRIRADKPTYRGIIVPGPVIVKAGGIKALAGKEYIHYIRR